MWQHKDCTIICNRDKFFASFMILSVTYQNGKCNPSLGLWCNSSLQHTHYILRLLHKQNCDLWICDFFTFYCNQCFVSWVGLSYYCKYNKSNAKESQKYKMENLSYQESHHDWCGSLFSPFLQNRITTYATLI